MLLSNRRVLVTGAGRGLGHAIARLFASEGASVVLADMDGDAAARGAAEISAAGGSATATRCDVTKQDEVVAAVQLCDATYGGLDIMVNNAGVTRDKTMRKMTLEDFRFVIDVNLVGTWLGTREAGLFMREHGGGSIINMSSTSGKVGNPGQTNYSAAKAGIVGLTKAAAKELAPFGVRVNCLQPGVIRTDMTALMPPEIMASKIKEVPLGRVGEPLDVANAALFLASDLSTYLTGQAIEVTGGRSM
ncbi:MAG: 3-oxoacyl-ACP reductase FabG [Marmoricola sp.]|nr:3-oxoacyl-ACP reductase FabG [Marmoricola sp.]